MKPIHYALLVAVAVIVALILLWPDTGPSPVEQEREAQYQREIAILKVEKAQERAAKDSIASESKERARKDSITLKALESKTKIAIQRAKEAEAKIPKEELTPAVVEALAAKDTAMLALQTENDSLRGSLYDTGKEFIAFQEADIREDKFTERLIVECEARNAELLDQIERMQKKRKSLWTRLKQIGTHGAAYGAGYLHGKASG